jgi:hypothetical protein
MWQLSPFPFPKQATIGGRLDLKVLGDPETLDPKDFTVRSSGNHQQATSFPCDFGVG